MEQAELNLVDTNFLMRKIGVTRPTIQSWRDTKRIPFFQKGRVIRYNYEEVLKALEDRRGGGV